MPNARTVLKSAGLAGVLAIVGQLVVYTFLAKQDVAGTSSRVWSGKVGKSHLRIVYPNTWRPSLKSTSPEFLLLLQGPQNVQLQIAASSGLLPQAGPPDDKPRQDPLAQLHSALRARALLEFSDYSEAGTSDTTLLPERGLVSFFSAESDGGPVEGARYTMVDSAHVWSIVAYGPERRWQTAVPVVKRMIQSMEVD